MCKENDITQSNPPVINGNQLIDELEFAMLTDPRFKLKECPVEHRFTPGLYTREIFMPAGMRITSMIHKTEHQFIVLQGSVSVYSENDGEQLITAPFIGKTLPGTRRVLLVHEDTRWITCHPTDVVPENNSEKSIEDAVNKIMEQIIEFRENPLLGGVVKNNVLIELNNKQILEN